jgi:hypothetical protein
MDYGPAGKGRAAGYGRPNRGPTPLREQRTPTVITDQTPSTLPAVPAAAADLSAARGQPTREKETDPKMLLQRQGERRRETERKLALHIQKYRETHPFPPE